MQYLQQAQLPQRGQRCHGLLDMCFNGFCMLVGHIAVQHHKIGANGKLVYDFLLVNNSNICSNSHPFKIIADY